jgi:hypothetical protein
LVEEGVSFVIKIILLPVEIEENNKNTKDSQCPSQNSNWISPEHKSLDPTCLVIC